MNLGRLLYTVCARGSKWEKVERRISFRRSAYIGEVEQMFLGQYEHTIDEKGRLTIPARYRDQLEDGAFVTQGLDNNLVVFTADAFDQVRDSVATSSYTDPKARLLRRLLFSQADRSEVDKAGRLLIPQFLRQKNNLEGVVIVAGNGAYFEIWSKEAWGNQEDQIADNIANEDRFAAINLLIKSK